MNRRTGKCMDLDGSSPKRLVQRTCSTSNTQRFLMAPTGNLRQVNGNLVAIDPTYGLDAEGVTSAGSCAAACVSISTKSLAGSCCSCLGVTKRFSKAAWNAATFLCL